MNLTSEITKRKLLLADDSVTIRKVVELTFAEEGIEVISAGDGDAAMQKFVAQTPDIVLVDVEMPGVSGYKICEMIKGDESTKDIPVLLLVGSFEPFDQTEAERVEADGYLTKPFHSIRELVAKVNELLPATDAPTVRTQETDDIESLYNSSFAETLPAGEFAEEDLTRSSFADGGEQTHEFSRDVYPGSTNDPSPPDEELFNVDDDSRDDEMVETLQPHELNTENGYGGSAAAAEDLVNTLEYVDRSLSGETLGKDEPEAAYGADLESEGLATAASPKLEPSPVFHSDPRAETVEMASPFAAPAQSDFTNVGNDESSASPEISDEMITLIAKRVVDKLSDRAVREIAQEAVPRIAEKLIREALEEEKKD